MPILSTKHHATVQEIIDSGAGVIVKQDVDDYVRAITLILEDYDSMSDKSRLWAKKNAGAHARLIDAVLKSMA